ncbi:MAG: DUF1425 domain-containing protein [Planctomycetota bacterium]
MKSLAILVVASALAGCATAPPKERLEVRHLAAGEEAMEDLVCVSVEIGSQVRVVLRNKRDTDRAIVWFPRWRSNDGYSIKSPAERVRELLVPANGEAAIVAQPPSAEARQFEVLIGDRP